MNEIIVGVIGMDDVMSVILSNLINLEVNYTVIIVLVLMNEEILYDMCMRFLV